MAKFPYFVGEAKPSAEIERGARQHYPWKEMLAAIAPGTGQEVRIKYDVCKAAIARLGLEDEYHVRSRGSGPGRRVFIVRRGHG